MRKSHISIITIVSVLVVALSLPTSIYNNVQLFTGLAPAAPDRTKIPFGSILYVNDVQPFGIPLDITSANSAPAILCSLTNNIHLLGTDGSDYSSSNSGSLFTPTFMQLLTPNNVPLATARIIVYLYCSPVSSYYSSIGYHAYLTGGNLQMQLSVRTSNGFQQVSTLSQAVSYGSAIDTSGTGSVPIAQFDVPASQINSVFGSSTLYATDIQISTSGTLLMKNKLGSSFPTFTYNAPALYSYMGLLNQNAKPVTYTNTQTNTCPTGFYKIPAGCTDYHSILTMITPNSVSSYKIDKSKSDIVQFSVQLDGYIGSQEANPSVDVSTISNSQVIKNVQLTPTSSGSSVSNWSGSLSIKNDLGGKTGSYVITVHPDIVSTGGTRQIDTAAFSVIDSSTTETTPTSAPSVTTNTQSSGLTSYFIYRTVYSDGTEDDGNLGSATRFPIKVVNDLISTSKGKAIKSSSMNAYVDLSTLGLNVKTTNVNIGGSIILKANGNNLPAWLVAQQGIIKSSPISVTFPLFSNGGGQYSIGQFQITPAQIDTILSNQNQVISQVQTGYNQQSNPNSPSQITPNTIPDGTPITFIVTVNGTFDMITNAATNAVSHAILAPMNYTQNFVYHPSTVPLSQCVNIDPSNPPAGCTNDLNTNLPKSSTAGNCVNLTPNQCAALGASNNNPSGNNQPCATGDGTCNTSTLNGQNQQINNNQCTTLFGIQTCGDPNSQSQSSSQLNANGTPSQSNGNSISCPAGVSQQDCFNNYLNNVQIPTINWNQVLQYVGIAVAISVIVYIVIKKRTKNG